MHSKVVFRAIAGILLFAGTTIRAQVRGVFVTPIANAPFIAVVTEQRTAPAPNQNVVQGRSMHAIARNSAGVIYNENRPLVPADFTGDPPVITSHIYDPQTRLNTFIYPQQKVYRQNRMARPPATVPPDLYAAPEGSTLPASQFTEQKDLGMKTIEGLFVHGVLISQHLPSPNQGGPEITITEEYWYSADLRLNMLTKHTDPRFGVTTMAVTQVSRTEPDESTFQIPSGYQPVE